MAVRHLRQVSGCCHGTVLVETTRGWIESRVLEVGAHFAHRGWVHWEQRIGEARRHCFVENAAESRWDALNGGHSYRGCEFRVEEREE